MMLYCFSKVCISIQTCQIANIKSQVCLIILCYINAGPMHYTLNTILIQQYYTNQHNSMTQAFTSNAYYPLNYDHDEIVSWVRTIICIIFCLEILLIGILRICSILLTPLKMHHHKHEHLKTNPTQENKEVAQAKKQDLPLPFPVLQLQSAVYLKEKDQKKPNNAKMNMNTKKQSNIKKQNQKIKVVDISKSNEKKPSILQKKNTRIQKNKNVPSKNIKKDNNKQNKLKIGQKNKQKNKQVIQIQQKEITNDQLIKRKPALKQSNLTNENQHPRVAFNFDQVIEFPQQSSSQSSQSCSSSSSSSSSQQQQSEQVTQQQQHLFIKEHKKDMKHFIRIKNLNKSFAQFSSIVNLLFSHFSIAFSVGILYFPYAHTAVLAIFHLILILILILLNIFCSKENKATKYVNRFICGLIYMINLAAIVLSIFGIVKSNHSYYQTNRILFKTQDL